MSDNKGFTTLWWIKTHTQLKEIFHSLLFTIHLLLTKLKKMEKTFNLITDFLGGLGKLFLAVVPVSILWFVLTGTSVVGVDVVTNLTQLITNLGQGGFVGLVVLVLICSFFTPGKK